MFYYWWTAYPNYIFFKLENKNVKDHLPYIHELCAKYFNDLPFNYFWLDEYYNDQFKNEKHFGEINSLLFILIIILSSIGLYGISAYLMSIRTKEIAIRNVLGSSALRNIKLLTKEYLILIIINYIIAIPIARILLVNWLDNYPYKLSFGWWFYLIPLIILFVIIYFSIGYNVLKISLLKPVNSLRYE